MFIFVDDESLIRDQSKASANLSLDKIDFISQWLRNLNVSDRRFELLQFWNHTFEMTEIGENIFVWL